MPRSTQMVPSSREEARPGLFRTGPRLVRSDGGIWERFFLLSLFLWGGYALALMAWAFFVLASMDAVWRVGVASFSYLSLKEVWLTPIMSASIMRAMVRMGLNQNADGDDNALLLAKYLDSLGHGGHWMLGNILSLAYLGILAAWVLIALDFPSLTGTSSEFWFVVANVILGLPLGIAYHLLLGRLLGQARRAGYTIQYRRRWSG